MDRKTRVSRLRAAGLRSSTVCAARVRSKCAKSLHYLDEARKDRAQIVFSHLRRIESEVLADDSLKVGQRLLCRHGETAVLDIVLA